MLSYVTGGAFGKSSEVSGVNSSETAPEDTGLSVEEAYAEALQHEEGDELSERKETAEAVSVREDDGRESDIGSMILVSGVDYVPDRGENFDGEGVADTAQFTAAGERGLGDVQGLGSTRWVPGREVEDTDARGADGAEAPAFLVDSDDDEPLSSFLDEETEGSDSDVNSEGIVIGSINVQDLLGNDTYSGNEGDVYGGNDERD